ncbi:hypothetical protein GW17_00053605 [Ensete ventricosum]|nr:hypothetical protein GW17_00053605 [Ensete ventricosum]
MSNSGILPGGCGGTPRPGRVGFQRGFPEPWGRRSERGSSSAFLIPLRILRRRHNKITSYTRIRTRWRIPHMKAMSLEQRHLRVRTGRVNKENIRLVKKPYPWTYSRPDTGKVGTPYLQTHVSLQGHQVWWKSTTACRPPKSSSESPLIRTSSHSVPRRPRVS